MASDLLATFIDRHVDAWNRHDANELCLHHAATGVVMSPMFARIEGRAPICSSYASLFAVFPDWRIVFGRAIREENRVAISFSVTATHTGEFMGLPGTGKRCEFEGVSLFELDSEGLILEERRFYDFTGLLSQLGVLRIRPAR